MRGRVASGLSGLLLVAGMALFGAAILSGPEPALAATVDVSITDGGFSPQSITVPPGTTVTWTNNSSSTQTVNAMLSGVDPNFFASPFIYTGQSWSHTFSSNGTFNYKSVTTNLTGSVVVDASVGDPPTPMPTPTSGGGGGAGGGASVSITDGGFVPQSISVPAGATVTWTNNSGSTQTVNAMLSGVDPNFFASPFIYTGQSWSHTFSSAGTFNYKSVTTNFTGTVVVGGGGGGGLPTNTPIPTPTKTPVPTATNTPVSGNSPTSAPGATNTPTPTRTPTSVPGATKTPTPTSTPATAPGAKATPTPTKTSTPGSGSGGSGPFGPLDPGWNLVTYGGPSGGPAQALFQLGSEWTAAYYWDGHEWRRYFRPGVAPSYLNNMGSLQSGQPLWILATGSIP